MYSIALLMALTGGSEVADGHRHHGGGCCGYVESCGCYGGGHRHHRHHRGHGCCGYDYGCGCYGYNAGCGCCGVQVYNCCGCFGGYGGGFGGGYGAPPMAAPPGGEQIKKMPAEKHTAIAAPAVIVVELPADATLKVDGEATTSTSGTRVLVSPELPAGQVFHYTLTAEVVREGKAVQTEQRVTVRGGEESRVNLTLPTAVASR